MIFLVMITCLVFPNNDLVTDELQLRYAIYIPIFDKHIHLGIDTWFPRPSHKDEDFDKHSSTANTSSQSVFLFDIAADPEERVEVSKYFPHIVDDMLSRLAKYNSTAVPVWFPDPDPKANPDLYGGFWVPWQ